MVFELALLAAPHLLCKCFKFWAYNWGVNSPSTHGLPHAEPDALTWNNSKSNLQ